MRVAVKYLEGLLIVAGLFILVSGVIDFIGGRARGRWDQTRRALVTFQHRLHKYTVVHQKVPSTLAEAAHAVSHDAKVPVLVSSGKDAWGRPLIYTVAIGDQIEIRSIGPNGRDDMGDVDDIEVLVPLSKLDLRDESASSNCATMPTDE